LVGNNYSRGGSDRNELRGMEILNRDPLSWASGGLKSSSSSFRKICLIKDQRELGIMTRKRNGYNVRLCQVGRVAPSEGGGANKLGVRGVFYPS